MGVPISWGLTKLEKIADEHDLTLDELVQVALHAEPKDKIYQQSYEALLDTRSSFFSPYPTYRFLRTKFFPI